ncbi:MAG TPA: SUMF1/EgtB/PvdO family nonheme iron enzyme [Chitinophagaceae bacterium]|nr:SUMF1/EgtB/PvdO family nonheme iron enzyme [Chitinophagaceae bacterium]
MKKGSLLILGIVCIFINTGYGQQPVIQGKLKELFAGPAHRSDHDAWLSRMKQWRTTEKDALNYNDAEYLRPRFRWLKKTFIYVQMMACDRYFYDPVSGKYTVSRYLDDLKKQYGGIDAVLIWPTYPNIGIDNRNQYDLLHDMPGGIKGVRQMVAQFKSHGVRVFFPIMIWDRGTRKIVLAMPVALIKEMKEAGADGMNGDTMWGVTKDFRDAYDSLGYPVVLQPEVAIRDLKMVEWNTSSWGYYWNYTTVPGVSIYKWLEPRHQVFVTNRWAVDKTDDLQYAFFNGIGYNAWENIWGIWNQIPDRYEAAIRRIATIYREFPDAWSSADWEPFAPTLQQGIFASRFPSVDKTLYTIVNRGDEDRSGGQLMLPYREGMSYFDVWHGVKLSPDKRTDSIYLNFPVEAHGFGAVLAVKSNAVKDSLSRFLRRMHTLSERPLRDLSVSWKPLPQKMVPIGKTAPASKTPAGMVLIPGTKNYLFESKGVMIEGDPLPDAVGVQYPWEEHPARATKHTMTIPSFYIDQYPVTNKQFKAFISATHYHPKDDHHFLKNWENGDYPKGWGDKPVTWVSLEDARAYAAWKGKRLPHEWEWQYAAQGNDNRLYPWGNQLDVTRMPRPDSGRSMRPPADVNAFPKGASPYGVMDMVGNVWQWTDEYTDEHTRAAVLKGGGHYRSTGSKWYFPRADELNKYGKYLLMSPGMDRSAAIGFRCVKDR